MGSMSDAIFPRAQVVIKITRDKEYMRHGRFNWRWIYTVSSPGVHNASTDRLGKPSDASGPSARGIANKRAAKYEADGYPVLIGEEF